MGTKLFFTTLLGITFFSSYSQTTAIPDAQFEAALIFEGFDSGPINGSVPTANISNVVFLNVQDFDIVDMTGIEAFTNLEELWTFGNDIKTLNLSNNTKLKKLRASTGLLNAKMETLILPETTTLEHLACAGNALTELDVTGYPNLINLYCRGNEFTSLDISNNSNLEVLECYDNNLTELNLNNVNSLTTFRAENNPNLTCIQVDDVAVYTSNSSYSIDSASSYSLDCKFEQTYVPDDNFEQALIDLGYDDVLDDYVVKDNISSLTDLFINNKGISDLTGIEDFIALTSLNVDNNSLTSLNVIQNINLFYLSFSQNNIDEINLTKNLNLELVYMFDNNLTSLDVSSCSSLIYLACNGNNLSVLDVSSNTNLEELYCYGNNIETLDLSYNTSLMGLLCDDNNLSSLNFKNGNNQNVFTFDASLNPDLICIQVDDVSTIDDTWKKDDTAAFNESCVTNVNVSGIEDFEDDMVGAKEFILDGNTFTLTGDLVISEYLNFSCDGANTGNNYYLDTGLNDGTSSGNIGSIIAPSGTTFILSSSTNQCGWPGTNDGNSFTTGTIKFIGTKTDNTKVEEEIEITSVSYTTFYPYNLSPSIWENTELLQLSFEIISGMDYWAMDNLVFEAKTLSADFVENIKSINVFPNPVKNNLHVSIGNNQTIKKLQVYNLLGSKVIEQKSELINFTNIPSGIYYLRVLSVEGEVAVQKIIKE